MYGPGSAPILVLSESIIKKLKAYKDKLMNYSSLKVKIQNVNKVKKYN